MADPRDPRMQALLDAINDDWALQVVEARRIINIWLENRTIRDALNQEKT